MSEETTSKVEQAALALPDEARAITIRTDEEFSRAGEWLRTRCKAVLAEVNRAFDPIIRKAHDAHREALAQKQRIAAPIEQAERIVKGALAAYSREQERQRQEVQRAAEAAARKLAEEEALRTAQALQDAGRADEADAVLEQPLPVMPVVVQKPAPVAAGVSMRVAYRAEVTSLLALVQHVAAHPENLNLVQANGVALNQLARSMRSDLAIPGVRVVAEDVVAARA